MRQLFTPLPHAFPEFHRSLHRLFCTRRGLHKLSRVSKRVLRLEAAKKVMAEKYEGCTKLQLIARIQELEQQIRCPEQTSAEKADESSPTISSLKKKSISTPPKPPKPFDASRYSTRLIALKFAYLGQKYNGFEHHNKNKTPLPTIEEELWKALIKTRVMNPTPREGDTTDYNRLDRNTFAVWDKEGADVNWEGCEYSKCGRTDRGVSAFGQVIGVKVRSNRPLPKSEPAAPTEDEPSTPDGKADSEHKAQSKPFDDLTDELPYIQLLNRVLPPDIRIYAWCPNPPPNFSARFSCKERRYKYFFTNPSFAPVPGAAGIYNTATDQDTMREGWIDIGKMREGCKELIGLHDFRNFCKIDASKQITNFQRRIFHADVEEISPLSLPAFLSHTALQSPSSADHQPKIYAFTLHGSAFLWHQVRNIVAILFLIGQRLEAPSLVSNLLDMEKNPTRPKYEMASDAPLVLWDCIFPHDHEVQTSEEREHGYTDRLKWVYIGDEGAIEPKSKGVGKYGGPSSMGKGKWGRGGVIDDVWEVWRGNKIDETLSALLLDKISSQGEATLDDSERRAGIARGGPRVFDGGNLGRAKGPYTPVLQRERQESVEVVNERFAKKKGLDPNRFNATEEDADE
ncbi:pseudouridine synthase [Dothidotthia symphoricarpi CBS 119687]|uniref:Pseudouridine synthase n=1 Tax=Dothidotthia symphoricarpi CBS 119687 TaxID=1392245 RepID=A0A6A6ASM8_9PLEO|nr:pseudouridine synthase [Dothidotthia symphoricarpi CBS 119687]KAF2133857.1 pseudouridine synthase [Dothidotthia symphoricarpi CBS 119687]